MMNKIEQAQQIAWVEWFTWQYRDLAPLLHHSPNGGSRDIREAAKFKKMGVRAGFPDLFLAVPSNGYHGLFIEIKSEKGRVSAIQKAYHELLRRYGYKVEVVKDFDTFKKIIEEYLYKRL